MNKGAACSQRVPECPPGARPVLGVGYAEAAVFEKLSSCVRPTQ